jgi:hypothetical protein
MPSRDEVIELVRDDVERGLGSIFTAVTDEEGDGFFLPGRFVDTDNITSGDLSTLVWAFRCQHVDWFQGIPPSGTVLTVRGATVVDTANDEPEFHRYIDWLSVLSQLGYGIYPRKLVEEIDRDAMNDPKLPE